MSELTSKAYVGSMVKAKWQQFPGHFGGALSKELVSKGLVGTRRFDFRISHYQPMAYVEEHVHNIQEQIYYVLEGQGTLTLDGEDHLMGPHDYVWVPPGVVHGFTCCGTAPLIFFVLTAPAEDNETAR